MPSSIRRTMPSTPAIREPAVAVRNLYLLGRLAEYKYYNMDAIVARALELCDTLAEKGA